MALPLLALLCVAGTAHAQLVVPAGATIHLNGGHILLAGVDVDLAGQLDLGDGELLDAGSLDLQPGGGLDLGLGRFQLAGDWNNAGDFDAAQGLVEFIDGREPASASIRGANAFFDLSMVSASGKRYRLETGRTQGVGGVLTLRGEGPALQIDTTAGPLAFLHLAPPPDGMQDIKNVGVSDVHASGQHLAPMQTNQGGTGNDLGWFGTTGDVGASAEPIMIPAGSWLSALLLVLVLTVLGGLAVGRRQQ